MSLYENKCGHEYSFLFPVTFSSEFSKGCKMIVTLPRQYVLTTTHSRSVFSAKDTIVNVR